MKNCIQCDKRLFGTVAFCPFCGTTTCEVPVELAVAQTVVSAQVEELASAREKGAVAVAPEPDQERSQPQQPQQRKANGRAEKTPSRDAEKAPAVTVKQERQARAKAAPQKEAPQPVQKGQAKRPRKWLRNSALGAGAIVVVLMLIGRGASKHEVACNQQIDAGTKLLQSGDLAGAAQQGKLAAASCTGSLEAKATAFQTLVTNAESAAASVHAQCSRAYNAVMSRLHDGRLSAAVSGLNQLPLACAGTPDANQLKDQVEQASTAADTAEQQARTAIAAGNTDAAMEALNDLARLDRFRQVLPSLRAQATAIATTVPAVTSTDQAALASAAQPPVLQAPVAQPVHPSTVPSSGANGEALAAQQFIRDAQTALAQGRFDAAKTYLDTARRLNPDNPRIDALARVVRDRERQVLEDDTTIK